MIFESEIRPRDLNFWSCDHWKGNCHTRDLRLESRNIPDYPMDYSKHYFRNSDHVMVAIVLGQDLELGLVSGGLNSGFVSILGRSWSGPRFQFCPSPGPWSPKSALSQGLWSCYICSAKTYFESAIVLLAFSISDSISCSICAYFCCWAWFAFATSSNFLIWIFLWNHYP